MASCVETGIGGETIRTVSAALPGGSFDDPPVALPCINLDVTQRERAKREIAAFVQPIGERPPELFVGDWRKALNDAVHGWLAGRGVCVAALKRVERVALVKHLDARHLSEARRASDHAAHLLGVSRATIDTYLAEARGRDGDRSRMAA